MNIETKQKNRTQRSSVSFLLYIIIFYDFDKSTKFFSRRIPVSESRHISDSFKFSNRVIVDKFIEFIISKFI